MRSLEAVAEFIARKQLEMYYNGYGTQYVEVSTVLYAYDVPAEELSALVRKSYNRLREEQSGVQKKKT